MNDFREKYHRHSLRLRDYDYSKSGAYFITICTKNKECLLGEIIDDNISLIRLSPFGEVVRKFWLEIPEHFLNVELDEFVIMPNHIHGIIIIKDSVGAIHENAGSGWGISAKLIAPTITTIPPKNVDSQNRRLV